MDLPDISVSVADKAEEPLEEKLSKINLSYKPSTPAKEAEPENNILDEVHPSLIPPSTGEAFTKKKKSKRKSKTARYGSGFEPNYADAPITPKDWETERTELYAPSIDFAQRIETCIQLYRSKRRMDSERLDVFTSYLKYGGISTGPKPFGGTRGVDFGSGELDAEAIRQATATDYVDADKWDLADTPDAKWAVDFSGVLRGFLGEYALDKWDPRRIPMSTITNVVRNFLRYVRYHDVCPEHDADLLEAMRICDQADAEIPGLTHVFNGLYGHFNRACSVYWGGEQRKIWDMNRDWAEGATYNDETALVDKYVYGIPPADAEQVLRAMLPAEIDIASVALRGAEPVFVEVTAVDLPPPPPPPLSSETASSSSLLKTASSLGRFRARDIGEYPHAAPMDRTAEEVEAEAARRRANMAREYSFLLEREGLQRLRVGTKIYMHVGTLTNGTTFIDKVCEIHPSFWEYLPNGEYLKWTVPRAWDKGNEEGDGGFGEDVVGEGGGSEE